MPIWAGCRPLTVTATPSATAERRLAPCGRAHAAVPVLACPVWAVCVGGHGPVFAPGQSYPRQSHQGQSHPGRGAGPRPASVTGLISGTCSSIWATSPANIGAGIQVGIRANIGPILGQCRVGIRQGVGAGHRSSALFSNPFSGLPSGPRGGWLFRLLAAGFQQV